MADIRPMDLGEIVDGALTLYRRHFAQFIRLGAATLWLPLAGSIFIQVRFSLATPDQTVAMMQDHLAGFVGGILLFSLVYGVGALLLTAGTIHIISASYLGQTPRVSDALRLGMGKFWPLFVVAVAKALLIILLGIIGMVLLGIGGGILERVVGGALSVFLAVVGVVGLAWAVVYVYCGYAVTSEVVVLESLDQSFDAFGRSWALTQGARGKAFGLVVVAYLLVQIVPSLGLGVVSASVRLSAPGWMPAVYVAGALFSLAVAPVLPCIFTLLYYDLRARREGFDLEHIGRQLGLL